MKLTGDLKKVEESASREEKKAAIEQAGMELTDDELDKVAGGAGGSGGSNMRWTIRGTAIYSKSGAFDLGILIDGCTVGDLGCLDKDERVTITGRKYNFPWGVAAEISSPKQGWVDATALTAVEPPDVPYGG